MKKEESNQSLLCVIPGFGPPHLDLKREILANNIEQLQSTTYLDLNVCVFNYGTDSCGINCKEIFMEGFVAQFLYQKVQPDDINNFDYVVVILDDIELSEDWNTDRIIRNLKEHDLDILSPMLSPQSKWIWKYMLQPVDFRKNVIRTVTSVELFCYVFSKESYKKYYALLDERSAWLWGTEFALHLHGFRMGMLEGVSMAHHFQGDSYHIAGTPDPVAEAMRTRYRLGGICWAPPSKELRDPNSPGWKFIMENFDNVIGTLNFHE